MQKTKHTPRPWQINWEKYGKSSEMYGGKGEICEPVCIIPHDDVTTKGMKEVKANARLIAAAPELLEALQACVSAMYALSSVSADAAKAKGLAAIAKATGGEAA